MKTVFVIKDSKSDFPLSVCWDEGTAKETIGTLNSIDSSCQYNYTEVPIHFEDGTEVNVIAPNSSNMATNFLSLLMALNMTWMFLSSLVKTFR